MAILPSRDHRVLGFDREKEEIKRKKNEKERALKRREKGGG